MDKTFSRRLQDVFWSSKELSIYVLNPVGIITFKLFITMNKTNHLMPGGQNIGIDIGIVCFNQLHQTNL